MFVAGRWRRWLPKGDLPCAAPRGPLGTSQGGRLSPPPRHPHLAASGAAPVGEAVSSSGSRGVCQALETEMQEMDCAGARRPTQPASGTQRAPSGSPKPSY